mgnify:CR=1 FL=1|tara:strand:- start:7462 stop:7686 length:225 start_codon:yes stop_codon:yes gene_type:complete
MPSELSKKGLDKGLITQKQYDKLPAHLLDAIVKSKMKKGGGAKKKPNKTKPVKKPQGARVKKPQVDNRKKKSKK